MKSIKIMPSIILATTRYILIYVVGDHFNRNIDEGKVSTSLDSFYFVWHWWAYFAITFIYSPLEIFVKVCLNVCLAFLVFLRACTV